MNRKQFPLVLHSILNAEMLRQEVAKFYPQLVPIIRCELLQQNLNDIYILETNKEKYILKVFGVRTNLNQILGGIELINYLIQQKFPVVKIIANPDGNYMHFINAPEGKRYLMLFPYISGNQIIFDTDTSEKYGKLIANLHNLTEYWQPNQPIMSLDIDVLINKPVYHISQYLGGKKLEILSEIAAQCCYKIQLLPTINSYYGLCHGDIVDNAIINKRDAKILMLDFEWMGLGWRIYDVAQFFWAVTYRTLNFTEKSLDDTPSSLWKIFLESYQSVRALSQQEEQAIPAFCIARSLLSLDVQLSFADILGKELVMTNFEKILDTLCSNRMEQ